MEGKYNFTLCDMTPEHLPEVMRIELVSFRTPWPLDGFVSEMRRNHSTQRVVLARPAGAGGGAVEPIVAGYDVYWRLFGEMHLLNIATHPELRKLGIAAMMMDELMDAAAREGATRLTLEVRVNNGPALALYQKYGFRTIGLRKGYYSDTGEDGLIMARECESAALQGRG